MFWLFRSLCTLLGFSVICLGVLYLTKNIIVKEALTSIIPRSTTFNCKIEEVEAEPTWPLKIHLRGVTIENPPDFADQLAMDIPEAFLVLAPQCWQNKELVFSRVDLQIDRFNLVNTEPGGNNLMRFTAVAKRNESLPSGFNFESFQLHVTDPRFAQTRRYLNVDSQKKVAIALSELLAPVPK